MISRVVAQTLRWMAKSEFPTVLTFSWPIASSENAALFGAKKRGSVLPFHSMIGLISALDREEWQMASIRRVAALHPPGVACLPRHAALKCEMVGIAPEK